MNLSRSTLSLTRGYYLNSEWAVARAHEIALTFVRTEVDKHMSREGNNSTAILSFMEVSPEHEVLAEKITRYVEGNTLILADELIGDLALTYLADWLAPKLLAKNPLGIDTQGVDRWFETIVYRLACRVRENLVLSKDEAESFSQLWVNLASPSF
jgi:hypothetical protein